MRVSSVICNNVCYDTRVQYDGYLSVIQWRVITQL